MVVNDGPIRNRLLDSDVRIQSLSIVRQRDECLNPRPQVGIRNRQLVSPDANGQVFGSEIEDVHSIWISSPLHLVPLDGIKNDDGLLFARDGSLVSHSVSRIPNWFVGGRMS